jgi:hypothetical protein
MMYKIFASIQSRQALGKIGVWAGRNHPSTKNPQLITVEDQEINSTYKHERMRICLRELQLQFPDIMACGIPVGGYVEISGASTSWAPRGRHMRRWLISDTGNPGVLYDWRPLGTLLRSRLS